MTKIDTLPASVDSPCIRHCCLDENDVCMGCYRTLDEIKLWGMANTQTKRAIVDSAEQRKIMGRRSINC